VGLTTTAIFGNLGGYIFGNVRDKASNITRRYATPCRPITWVPISCLNPFFTCKSVARLPKR